MAATLEGAGSRGEASLDALGAVRRMDVRARVTQTHTWRRRAALAKHGAQAPSKAAAGGAGRLARARGGQSALVVCGGCACVLRMVPAHHRHRCGRLCARCSACPSPRRCCCGTMVLHI